MGHLFVMLFSMFKDFSKENFFEYIYSKFTIYIYIYINIYTHNITIVIYYRELRIIVTVLLCRIECSPCRDNDVLSDVSDR